MGTGPVVVYVGGAGRSGSTLLDNLLGSASNWFSTGELRLLWSGRQMWTHLCGCGEPLRTCPLWSAVLDQAGPVDVEWAAATERALLRSRQSWRPARRNLGTDGARYADLVGRLAAAITDVTGAGAIVDSSKSPAGVALWHAAGVPVVAVHLVRDPRAVVWSWRRTVEAQDGVRRLRRRPAATTAVEWTLNNRSMEAVTTRAGVPVVRVRYEDLIDEPSATIAAIATTARVEADVRITDGEATIEANHTVAGNPSRFRTGAVRLRRDDEWQDRMPRIDRVLTTALTAPGMRRYGYPLGAG